MDWTRPRECVFLRDVEELAAIERAVLVRDDGTTAFVPVNINVMERE